MNVVQMLDVMIKDLRNSYVNEMAIWHSVHVALKDCSYEEYERIMELLGVKREDSDNE